MNAPDLTNCVKTVQCLVLVSLITLPFLSIICSLRNAPIYWYFYTFGADFSLLFLYQTRCSLNTPACTFLGPSRKRGPPKGYIDAIEARLHQTEALLGIMLATSDARAHSLLRDMEKVNQISHVIFFYQRRPLNGG